MPRRAVTTFLLLAFAVSSSETTGSPRPRERERTTGAFGRLFSLVTTRLRTSGWEPSTGMRKEESEALSRRTTRLIKEGS